MAKKTSKKTTAKKSPAKKAPKKSTKRGAKGKALKHEPRFIMVVTPAFKAKMKAAAKKQGISMSGWVRNALEKALR